MPAIFGIFALLVLPAVGWEQRRWGSRRGLKAWAWLSPPVALLAVGVIALSVTGHAGAWDLLAVLAPAVAVVCAVVAFAARSEAS